MGKEINVGLISLIISISSINRDVEEGRKRMNRIVANAFLIQLLFFMSSLDDYLFALEIFLGFIGEIAQ